MHALSFEPIEIIVYAMQYFVSQFVSEVITNPLYWISVRFSIVASTGSVASRDDIARRVFSAFAAWQKMVSGKLPLFTAVCTAPVEIAKSASPVFFRESAFKILALRSILLKGYCLLLSVRALILSVASVYFVTMDFTIFASVHQMLFGVFNSPFLRVRDVIFFSSEIVVVVFFVCIGWVIPSPVAFSFAVFGAMSCCVIPVGFIYSLLVRVSEQFATCLTSGLKSIGLRAVEPKSSYWLFRAASWTVFSECWRNLHSASLSLYLRLVSADGENCRLFGSYPSRQFSIAQIGI